jgi:putative transposase
MGSRQRQADPFRGIRDPSSRCTARPPRHRIDGAIHHSEAESQYIAIYFGETLSLSGVRPSIASVGDAYDNALAETTIGLYKNECIRADSPFCRGPLRNLADVELVTADYVAWYNQ